MILKFRQIDRTVDETTTLQDWSFDSWEYVEGIVIEVYEIMESKREDTMLEQKYTAKIIRGVDEYNLVHFNTGYLLNNEGKTIDTFR